MICSRTAAERLPAPGREAGFRATCFNAVDDLAVWPRRAVSPLLGDGRRGGLRAWALPAGFPPVGSCPRGSVGPGRRAGLAGPARCLRCSPRGPRPAELFCVISTRA